MNRAKSTWQRRQYTANPADPTEVITWKKSLGRHNEIKLVASWGVELSIWLFGWKWSSYDSWFAKALFERLEERFEKRESQCGDELAHWE